MCSSAPVDLEFSYYLANNGHKWRIDNICPDFLVCSESCRRALIEKGTLPYSVLLDGVDLPKRYYGYTFHDWAGERAIPTNSVKWVKDANDGKAESLYIFGSSATGKTSLAAALIWEFRKLEKSIFYLDFDDFLYAANDEQKFGAIRSRLKKDSVLILDNLKSILNNTIAEIATEQFFSISYNEKKIVIITSNYHPCDQTLGLSKRTIERIKNTFLIMTLSEKISPQEAISWRSQHL